MGTSVKYSGHSDAGQVRTINQDNFFVGELGRGYLAVVADGMGGHIAGEVASKKAVDILHRELTKDQSYPPAALARAVQVANQEIYDHAAENTELSGMGTTLTVIYIDDQVGLIGHVGDSRAYLIRDSIKQLTHDHSWVADRVRQGILSPDEAKQHQMRNVITNALGSNEEVTLDLSHFVVQAGDKLLLCSDGISMLLSEDELWDIIKKTPPADASRLLVEEANKRGAPDNVTAVVCEVLAVEARPKNYALPEANPQTPHSIKINDSTTGIQAVEDTFPRQDVVSKLRRQAWYPYRLWIVASLYLILLMVIFGVWR